MSLNTHKLSGVEHKHRGIVFFCALWSWAGFANQGERLLKLFFFAADDESRVFVTQKAADAAEFGNPKTSIV
jgi:hypothetical protein